MTMITIISERNGHKTKFKDYKKLYNHITHHQRIKRHDSYLQAIDDWFLARHSYRRVMAFHDFVCTQKGKAKENTGLENSKFDVLEMSYGKSMQPVIIPITPDTDIESHLKDWCKKYCKSHGFKLIEVEEDDGVLHVKREPVGLFNLEITEAHLWWKG